MDNIRVVDDIVRQTEQLMSEFYGDEETSYVFTADHGMSKIGNHGDGGIGFPLSMIQTLRIHFRPQIPTTLVHPSLLGALEFAAPFGTLPPPPDTDEYSAPWELSHIVRRDVEQADVAALMSALLGTHWPVNSVGVLPDVDPQKDGYLSMRGGEREIAEAAVVNAKVNLSRCYWLPSLTPS
jgi:phosphatidylinositol glycan class N